MLKWIIHHKYYAIIIILYCFCYKLYYALLWHVPCNYTSQDQMKLVFVNIT